MKIDENVFYEYGKLLENPTVTRFEKCNSKGFGDIYSISFQRQHRNFPDMSEPATRLSRTYPSQQRDCHGHVRASNEIVGHVRAGNEIVGHVRASNEIVGHVRASNEIVTDMSVALEKIILSAVLCFLVVRRVIQS